MPNVGDAAIAAQGVLIPFVLFGGLMINLDSIDDWISWYQYLSPVRYTEEAFTWVNFNAYEGEGIFVEYDVPEMYAFRLGYATCCWCLFGIAVAFKALALGIFIKKSTEGFQ